MSKLLASSQITIVDLNDAVSLQSYITSTHPRVQFLNNNNTYIPDYKTDNVTLTTELYKLGNNNNLILTPGTTITRVDWYVKISPATTFTKILPTMSDYELIGQTPFFKGLKIKNNILNASNPGVTFKTEVDFKESWMPDIHTQITEIDFSLSTQGESGDDSFSVILTNPTHSILCRSNGEVELGEIGVSGRAYCDTLAFKGSKALTIVDSSPGKGQYSIKLENTNCTTALADKDTFYINTITKSNSIISKDGLITEDKESDDIDSVLAARNTSKGGKVKVTFNLEGITELTQDMTFTKVYNGNDGDNGVNGQDGESAKYLTLSIKEGSNVFKYEKNETTPNISQTTLKANTFNISSPTYQWSYYNGTWNSLSATTQELVVRPTDSCFNDSASVTFRCVSNNNVSDEITLSILKDGDDSMTIQMSNESHVIACINNGEFKPGEAEKAVTDIVAYKGAKALTLTTGNATSGKYKIEVVENSAIKYTLTNNVIKIIELNADSAVLLINVNCEGTIYKKTFSLSKARDGKEGIDGYTVSLTNEFHSLPALPNGNVVSYVGCSTSIELYKGADLIVEDVEYNAIASSGVTGTLVGNTYTVTNLVPDSSYVELVATYNGKSYPKIFTITKNKQGDAGVDSTSYWIISSTRSINKDKQGQLVPNSVTFESKSQKGDEPLKDYACRFKISVSTNGIDFNVSYTSAADETRKVFSVPANARAIKCDMYLAGGTITRVDSETVTVVSDGADGTNAAYVIVAGEQIFKYGPNFIGVPTPSQIVLTRTLHNTVGGKWQYNNGTTWVDFSPAQTGATLQVTPTLGHFATSSNKVMRVRFYVNESIYDETSIAKIADGSIGADAYTLLLSNSSHTVVADSDGNVTSQELAKALTEVIVYKGATKIKPGTITIDSKVPSTVDFAITQATDSTLAKIVMTAFPREVDSATVTLNIPIENKAFKQTFTITKAKKGVTGSSAKNVSLTGSNIFKYPQGSNVPTEATITLTAKEINFTGTSRKWYADNTVIPGQAGTNLVVAHNASYWNNKSAIVIKYETNGLIDEMTLTKLYDGSDAYTVVLDNESHTITCDSNGNPIANEVGPNGKAKTKLKVYKGSLELKASNTTGANKFKISTSGTMADGSGTCKYITETVNGAAANTGIYIDTAIKDSGVVPIVIDCDNGRATITKNFTFSKAKSGSSAKAIQITGSSTVLFKADGTKDPASGVVLNVSKKNTNGTIVWKHNNTQLATGDSYTVPITVLNNTTSYTVKAEVQGDTAVNDTHTIHKITDGKDSITSYIWCPNGNTIKNDSMSSVDIEAVVFNGSNNVSQTAEAAYFWEKKEGQNWVSIKGTSSNPVTGANNGHKVSVNQVDIPSMLVVRCTIKYHGITQVDSVVIEDIMDPVQATIFSTAGTIFKNGVGETYLVAKAIRNGKEEDAFRLVENVTGITGSQGEIVYNKTDKKYYKYNNNAWEIIATPESSTDGVFDYIWTKLDSNGDVVPNWNRIGKVVYLDQSEVTQKTQFMVDVEG